ncbi:hypothetical protein ABGN05_21050 [Aquibium sp. LZ166]|uniref:Uncharacterized protein n=1 Tax=Aquibium pacificus TaxID=3153579 RepID=A0ABV3SN02_9HYPH
MKINFSQTVMAPNGEELDVNLGQISVMALNAPEKEPLGLDESIRRGSLALKVKDGGEIEIKPEDAAMIRKNLPKAWAPFIVAQAAQMLDG